MRNETNATLDFFETAFQDGPVKTTSIAITVILMAILVPIGYGIIWYEKYGSDKKRILVNRLLTSLCWTGIVVDIMVTPLDMLRYFYGPLPVQLCYFQLILKNVLNVQGPILYNFSVAIGGLVNSGINLHEGFDALRWFFSLPFKHCICAK